MKRLITIKIPNDTSDAEHKEAQRFANDLAKELRTKHGRDRLFADGEVNE